MITGDRKQMCVCDFFVLEGGEGAVSGGAG